MPNLTPKYIKDEEGNPISPMTSAKTVMMEDDTTLETVIQNLIQRIVALENK